MSNTNELRVEVADTLRQQPELALAAERATRYLESQLRSHANVFGHTREVVWQFQADHIDGPRVAVGYTEDDSLGTRHVTRWLRPEELADPVARDVHMIHLLQDVLKQRWKQLDRVRKEHRREPGRDG